MFLIGQYDSPFVRRVAIAMRLYGIAFEHRPWSMFGDAEKIAPYNPLRRVPTLVLDDGEALIESTASSTISTSSAGRNRFRRRAMLPRSGAKRGAGGCGRRAGDRARRQGGQPALRARAARGTARDLGRALPGADIPPVLDVLEKERASTYPIPSRYT